MTHNEHRTLHGELLGSFDELVADYWRHHPLKYKSEAVRRLVESELTIRDLAEWAFEQAKEPSELEPSESDGNYIHDYLGEPSL